MMTVLKLVYFEKSYNFSYRNSYNYLCPNLTHTEIIM